VAALSLWGGAPSTACAHWHGGGWGRGFYRPYYGYGLGLGAFGLGLGLGYGLGYGFGPGYYVPYYGYGYYAPYYAPYGPAVYPPGAVASYEATANPPPAENGNQAARDNAAHLQLIVPENAEVWFAGAKIEREGRVREFVSPQLKAGQTYNYPIAVRYVDSAGKPVEDKRDIRVHANDWFTIDFTRPASSQRPAPLPPPLP
jgi:uncharacterized protein (TIGR03000 family)